MASLQSLMVSLLLVGLLVPSLSYRILVFMPYGSRSHKNTLLPLIRGLAEREHDVTFITNEASFQEADSHRNVEEVVVANLNYSMMDGSQRVNFFNVTKQSSLYTKVKIFEQVTNLATTIIRQTYSNERVQEILTEGRYDLLILSQVVSYAGYPLAWHFQCPYILSSPNILMGDSAAMLGDSEHSEYVPSIVTSYTDRMTLSQRVLNTVATHMLNFFQDHVIFPLIQPTIDEFFPQSPPLSALKANLSAAFANTHPVFNYPRAYPPGVVEVGAIHCRPAAPLPPVGLCHSLTIGLVQLLWIYCRKYPTLKEKSSN